MIFAVGAPRLHVAQSVGAFTSHLNKAPFYLKSAGMFLVCNGQNTEAMKKLNAYFVYEDLLK